MSEPLTVFPRPGPQPRVAVIAMSFNQGAFVDECLDSIARQEYPNLEVLAVDHASTDPWSVEAMRNAAARHDVRFLHLDDRGAPGPAPGAMRASPPRTRTSTGRAASPRSSAAGPRP